MTVAGNGSAGSAADTLNTPTGLFVDTNLDLYVADQLNQRIQRFRPGESNGTTVAVGIQPIDVSVDVDGYLFIVVWVANAVVRCGPGGCQPVVSLSGVGELSHHAFDSRGNIFVLDALNSRLQKFDLIRGPCRKLHQTETRQLIGVGLPYCSFVQSAETLSNCCMGSECHHYCRPQLRWRQGSWNLR